MKRANAGTSWSMQKHYKSQHALTVSSRHPACSGRTAPGVLQWTMLDWHVPRLQQSCGAPAWALEIDTHISAAFRRPLSGPHIFVEATYWRLALRTPRHERGGAAGAGLQWQGRPVVLGGPPHIHGELSYEPSVVDCEFHCVALSLAGQALPGPTVTLLLGQQPLHCGS